MSISARADYCLLLGSEMNRPRSLLAAARAVPVPVAVLKQNAVVNSDGVADVEIQGDPNNPERALAAVRRHQRRTGQVPVAVVPLTEMTILGGQAIARHYGLAYLSDEAVTRARSKFLMKSAFRDAGLPVPRFASFSRFGELEAIVEDFGFPVVVKPANAGGSEGVSLARSPQELKASYAHLLGAVSGYREKFGLSESEFQVEQYVEAPHEVSIEVINTPRGRQVLAVTDKYLSSPPYFVEIGHSLPSTRSGHAPLEQAALAACEALGIDRGIAHVESKILADGSPLLMEVNARTSGGSIPELFERVSGLNLLEMHCRSYADGGPPLPLAIETRGRAAVAFIKSKPGTIARVVPPAPEELPDEVVALKLWARPGQSVAPCVDSNTRGEGYILCHWPGDDATARLDAHLEIAGELAPRLIRLEEPAPGRARLCAGRVASHGGF